MEPVLFLLRRFISIFIVVYFRNQPMFQVFPLLVMSVINMSFLCWRERYKSKSVNRQEIFNEFVVYMTLVSFLIFTNTAIDHLRKSDIGWYVIALIALNMF
jgi:hypothetical protein